MKISTVIGAVSTALLMAVSASASHPEWSGQTGDVTVPAGKTWTMDDEDVAYVNANVNRVFVDGTLVLDNVTTWPKGTISECFFWTSAGTVIKRGSSSVTVNSYNYRLSGTLIIEEGEIVQNNYHFWGNRSTSSMVIIKDGATLRQEFAYSQMGGARIIAEGTGVNGQGAVIVNKGYSPDISYLILSNDATVVFNSSATILSSVSDSYVVRNPALLEMNGYTLTIGGTAATVTMNNVNVTGGGTIKFASGTARTFNANGTTDLGTTKIETDADLTLTKGTWANGIAVGADATLTLAPGEDATILTVSGAITGEGNVSIGTAATSAKGQVVLSSDNAYTGTTDLYGADTFMLALGSGTSIPDAEKFAQHGGTVRAMIGYKADGETPRWTADGVLALAKTQQEDPVKIVISDVTDCGSLTIAGALYSTYFPESGPTWSAFGTGDGGYTFEGPFTADNPLKLTISTGTVRLAGDDPIALGPTLVTGTAANQGGTLFLDGAADVSFGTDSIFLGNASETTPKGRAKMIVSNSYLHATCGSSLANKTGVLWVGHRAPGLLCIEEGSIVSNGLAVGGAPYAYEKGASYADVGAVSQRGGTVYPRSTSSVGSGYHGYYELLGGTLSGVLPIGTGYNSTGIFLQNGGTILSSSGFTMTQGNNYNTGVYCLLKGLCQITGGTVSASYSSGNLSEITVSGPESEFINRGASAVFYCNMNKDNETVFNLNDGAVFEMGVVYPRTSREDATKTYPVVYNFNGGFFRHGTAWDTPFNSYNPACQKVVVYEKGIGFDTYNPVKGATTFSTTGVNLEGATGNGIQAIALPEGGVPGCLAAPYVKITSTDADAYGATAVALVDVETATVTNILVTSHGWGYTAENTTVKLLFQNTDYPTRVYTVPPEDVTIGPNTVGGLTKIGAGTLNVYGANTWAQWTRVDTGTVKAMTNGAIPSGTELILNGATKTDATLDLNNVSDATFSGVSGTGGTVKNGIVKIVGEWKVSAKKFVDRETTDVAGTVDLTECTGITLVDTEALDESVKELRPLVLFKATTVIGLDGVTIKDVPNGWKVTKVANGFRMSADKGMMLLLR